MPFEESFFNEISAMTTTKEPRYMTKDILNKFITEANKLNDKDKDWFIREVEKAGKNTHLNLALEQKLSSTNPKKKLN
jgi:hypothetical protein